MSTPKAASTPQLFGGGGGHSDYPSSPAGQQAEWVVLALNDATRIANLPTIRERFAESKLQESGAEELRDWFAYYDQLVPAYEFDGVLRERSDHEVAMRMSPT